MDGVTHGEPDEELPEGPAIGEAVGGPEELDGIARGGVTGGPEEELPEI